MTRTTILMDKNSFIKTQIAFRSLNCKQKTMLKYYHVLDCCDITLQLFCAWIDYFVYLQIIIILYLMIVVYVCMYCLLGHVHWQQNEDCHLNACASLPHLVWMTIYLTLRISRVDPSQKTIIKLPNRRLSKLWLLYYTKLASLHSHVLAPWYLQTYSYGKHHYLCS